MNCIVIDDEPLARQGMEKLITSNNGTLTLLEMFSNTESARSFLKDNTVDLIFLDIEMPGENGLDFAREVAEDTIIIFSTAYPNYALKSYEVDALDYLVKPISEERFLKSVARASQQHLLLKSQKQIFDSSTSTYIMVKSERRFFKILYKDVLYIEGLKDYIVIHTSENRVITAMNLKTISKKLPEDLFIRVSKSYIVQKEAVKSFNSHTIYVQGNEIPLGKSYLNEFYLRFLGENFS